MSGLLDKIKADAQKTGGSRSKFFYVKDGEKRRVRFLQDMNDGLEITFHDNFEANINVPCRGTFGLDCPYCDEEGLRTRVLYAWSVWDYDSNSVKIFMYAMNNCTPIGAIVAAYETYGTLLDRDYIIGCTGKQKDKTMSAMPMDKNKFRNEKAKPFSHKAFLELLDEAYPDEHAHLLEEDDKKKPTKMKPASKAKKVEVEDEEDEEKELPWNDTEENESENDYSEMTPKELFKLCKERGIEALPKKNEKYYINLLEEDDKAHDDWEDDEEAEDEDDDWE